MLFSTLYISALFYVLFIIHYTSHVTYFVLWQTKDQSIPSLLLGAAAELDDAILVNPCDQIEIGPRVFLHVAIKEAYYSILLVLFTGLMLSHVIGLVCPPPPRIILVGGGSPLKAPDGLGDLGPVCVRRKMALAWLQRFEHPWQDAQIRLYMPRLESTVLAVPAFGPFTSKWPCDLFAVHDFPPFSSWTQHPSEYV